MAFPRKSEVEKRGSQRWTCRRCWGENSLTSGRWERAPGRLEPQEGVCEASMRRRARARAGSYLQPVLRCCTQLWDLWRGLQGETHHRWLRKQWMFNSGTFSTVWVDNWGSLYSNTLLFSLHLGGSPHFIETPSFNITSLPLFLPILYKTTVPLSKSLTYIQDRACTPLPDRTFRVDYT